MLGAIKSFTHEDVKKWVGEKTLEKAIGYTNSVSALEVQGTKISAQVQGKAREPYRVNITFDAQGSAPKILRCTCPVGISCKHTAATLLKASERTYESGAPRPEVLSWLDDLVSCVENASDLKRQKASKNQRIIYGIRHSESGVDVEVEFYKARFRNDNTISGGLEHWSNVDKAIVTPPTFLDESDLSILRRLFITQGKNDWGNRSYFLKGVQGDKILRQMVSTGRLVITKNRYSDYHFLKSGPTRPGHLEWIETERGRFKPQIITTPMATQIIPTEPLWYLDENNQEVGQIEIGLPAKLIPLLLNTPSFTQSELGFVLSVLEKKALPIPLPKENIAPKIIQVIDTEPTPILFLESIPEENLNSYHRHKGVDFAILKFNYDGVILEMGAQGEMFTRSTNEVVQIKRKTESEKKAARHLAKLGFEALDKTIEYFYFEDSKKRYQLSAYGKTYSEFLSNDVENLKNAGWEIIFGKDFRHFYYEPQEWEIDFENHESGWFDLFMGIQVDGEKISLVPLLSRLFKNDSRWLNADEIQKIKDDAQFFFETPQGKRFAIPANRLKPIASTLMDLFNGNENIRISALDAPRLADLIETRQNWQFKNSDEIIAMAKRLQECQKPQPVQPPQNFLLQLRHYQLEGLSWLQYLREHRLSGILADDMGLGKTAQTLAHIQLEKEQGRLTLPTLIVLPTSLVFNWRNEAQKFAPELSVLVIHGASRKALYEQIASSDVVLTTYSLLWRDHEQLSKQAYYYLILDEAQMVKNSKTNAALVIRNIQCQHRLCITGTPLENHLGELWSQFDFLMPGFLGDQKSFTKIWRNPIEKDGDNLRRAILAKRIKPFMLRRVKEAVAQELPPKTVIIRSIKIEEGQRDLYETVRTAMDKKVREVVAAQGLARSQIVILDALLKLRQVCCDPRLLKTETAKKVKEHAKLDYLMDMLEELLAEGRRILIFSQFTSMLALIENALDAKKMEYVILTGQTIDRETPIRAFQEEKVPLFLISLKSGGVGLNLTAADTVIHFDPWWNPAVENQATDRAHRLGQTKPIFVYKLIIEGSIEEKILQLQDKKAALAASILSNDTTVDMKFSTDDLAALFEPLGG